MAGTNKLLGKADRKTDLSQGVSVAKAETGLDLRVFVSHYLLFRNHFAGLPPPPRVWWHFLLCSLPLSWQIETGN